MLKRNDLRLVYPENDSKEFGGRKSDISCNYLACKVSRVRDSDN
jgi:hypothetical protein